MSTKSARLSTHVDDSSSQHGWISQEWKARPNTTQVRWDACIIRPPLVGSELVGHGRHGCPRPPEAGPGRWDSRPVAGLPELVAREVMVKWTRPLVGQPISPNSIIFVVRSYFVRSTSDHKEVVLAVSSARVGARDRRAECDGPRILLRQSVREGAPAAQLCAFCLAVTTANK